jgi:hypothetical protein
MPFSLSAKPSKPKPKTKVIVVCDYAIIPANITHVHLSVLVEGEAAVTLNGNKFQKPRRAAQSSSRLLSVLPKPPQANCRSTMRLVAKSAMSPASLARQQAQSRMMVVRRRIKLRRQLVARSYLRNTGYAPSVIRCRDRV